MGSSVPVLLLLLFAVTALLQPGNASFCSKNIFTAKCIERKVLDVDLTTGVSSTPPAAGANWYSRPSGSGRCGKQAIVRIPINNTPFNPLACIQFDLYLSNPSGWNFLISETRADGYGGTGPASEATEVHNVDKKFLIYPNLLSGNQAYGSAVVEDAITNRMTILICDKHVEVDNYKGMQKCYDSEYLFTLSGRNNLYFGMNRVITQRWSVPRVGTGLCRAVVKTVNCRK